jgi:hypothetical protein
VLYKNNHFGWRPEKKQMIGEGHGCAGSNRSKNNTPLPRLAEFGLYGKTYTQG